MRILKSALLVVLFTLIGGLSSEAIAQDENTVNKFTKTADNQYKAKNYYGAIAEYKKAYSKTKDKKQKAEITYRMAYCYYQTLDLKKAVGQFEKCIKIKYEEEHPIVYLQLAESYKGLGKYEEALVQFNKYKEAEPSDKRGANGAKSCELAIAWKENPSRYKVTNMAVLNSKQHDVAPAYADKKFKSLVFSSTRDGATGNEDESAKTGQSVPDLYYTSVDRKGKWSKPSNEPFAETINSKISEGGPAFNSRVNTLYFTKCGIPGKKDGQKYCHIYTAKKMGNGYGEATKAILIDSSTTAHPSISADDKVMYFAADLPGGYGGYDIWKATYNKREKVFENPINLGPQINTDKNEMYPFIHKDGTLYFSSNGHLGMGGYDIFKVEADGESWGPVVNMKYPINSEGDDVSIIFEGDKERGYFSSSRGGGKGSLDIYSFVLPKLEFMVSGVVKDIKTQEILKGCTVKMVGSDGTTLEAITDEAGAYNFTLAANTNYTLAARSDEKKKNGKQKYFASESKMLTTVGVEESKNFQLDFELEPVPETPIVLPNIIYLTNDTTLLPESKIALNGLVKVLNDNPNFTIKIMSHTDFRGTDAANQILSRGRANSVVVYLVDEKGIEAARLTSEGKGETTPRSVTEDNLKDFQGICAEFKVKFEDHFKVGDVMSEAFITKLGDKQAVLAAHQFNRRTEFEITGEDYVSPNKTVAPEGDSKETQEEVDN